MKIFTSSIEKLQLLAIKLGISTSFTIILISISGGNEAVGSFKSDPAVRLGMCFDEIEDSESEGVRVLRYAMKVPNAGREIIPLVMAAKRHDVKFAMTEAQSDRESD